MINVTPNHEEVLENVQVVIFYYQINQLKGFLIDSLIERFPAGSKIYIFGRLFKSDKLLMIRLIRRYMTTVVFLIMV